MRGRRISSEWCIKDVMDVFLKSNFFEIRFEQHTIRGEA